MNKSLGLEDSDATKERLSEQYKHILGEFDIYSLSIEEIIKKICRYYEEIITCMPGNVYWLNNECVAMGGNQNVLDMFGLSSMEEFCGLNFEEMGEIAHWSQQATRSFRNDTLDVIRTGKSKLNIEEPPIPTANGEMIYFLTSRVPVFDSRNNVIAVVGISVDVTELKRAKEKAEAANKIKLAFIENMQHDLRTPAYGVASGLAALLSAKDDKVDKEELTTIYESAKQLYKLCREVTDFDKIGRGERPVVANDFSLLNIIESVISLNQAAAQEKGLDLNFSIVNGIPDILVGDSYRLKRILINLIGNAIKFTQKGYVQLRINYALDDNHDVVLNMDVRDTGIGIPQDKIEFIYDEFTRVTPSNQGHYQGIGLGLRIVKKFVEDLNGSIKVNSSKKGTVFNINLPVKVSTATEVPQDEVDDDDLLFKTVGKEQVAVLTNNKSKENEAVMLLVEDDLLARMAAMHTLSHIGYRVKLADSVQSAIDMLDEERFSLVLSDIGLPDGTGFDIAQYINNNPSSKNYMTPAFALTAHSGSDISRKAKKAGFLALISKPLAEKKFKQLLKTYLEKDEALNSDIINFQLVRQHGMNRAQAVEMLQALCQELPTDIAQVKKYQQELDTEQLKTLLHRLVGGLSYVGVQRLQQATKALYAAIKKGDDLTDITPLFNKFYSETDYVLIEYEKLKQSKLIF